MVASLRFSPERGGDQGLRALMDWPQSISTARSTSPARVIVKMTLAGLMSRCTTRRSYASTASMM